MKLEWKSPVLIVVFRAIPSEQLRSNDLFRLQFDLLNHKYRILVLCIVRFKYRENPTNKKKKKRHTHTSHKLNVE